MSEALSDPPAAPRPHRTPSLRALAWRARQAQLSGNALLGAGVALSVLAAAMLLWSGIVTGAPRVVLLLLAAGGIRLRLLATRLSGMVPADGVAEPPPSGPLRRWMSLWETAALLLAAGMAAYGSGSRIGPMVGGAAGGLLLLVGLRRRAADGAPLVIRPHPTTLLAVACLVAAFEPLWGWRGQSLVIGAGAIAAVLAVQLARPARHAA